MQKIIVRYPRLLLLDPEYFLDANMDILANTLDLSAEDVADLVRAVSHLIVAKA